MPCTLPTNSDICRLIQKLERQTALEKEERKQRMEKHFSNMIEDLIPSYHPGTPSYETAIRSLSRAFNALDVRPMDLYPRNKDRKIPKTFRIFFTMREEVRDNNPIVRYLLLNIIIFRRTGCIRDGWGAFAASL